MQKIVSSGDIGDCIAALPITRQLGIREFYFTQGKNPRPFQIGAKMLVPLFEAQDYIDKCAWALPQGITHDLSGHWRHTHYNPRITLAESQASVFGIRELNLSPWLKVHPSPVSKGKIVIARSRRYNNNKFPWKQVLKTYRDKLLFIGLPDEKVQLERMVGWNIPHYKVPNFLIMAEVIAGSDFIICNQSSPGWVAMGLGHPIVQETSPGNNKDSKVFRHNAHFFEDGVFPFDNPPNKREEVHNYEI